MRTLTKWIGEQICSRELSNIVGMNDVTENLDKMDTSVVFNGGFNIEGI